MPENPKRSSPSSARSARQETLSEEPLEQDRYIDNLRLSTTFEDMADQLDQAESATRGKVLGWLVFLSIVVLIIFAYRYATTVAPLVHWYQGPQGTIATASDTSISLRTVEPVRLAGSVLSKKTYKDDMGAVSPLDIVLGWNEYLEPSRASSLRIWQADRTYNWVNPGVGSLHKVVTSTANLHLIASDSLVLNTLQNLQVGDLVRLTGQIVDVQKNGEIVWTSSTQPDDVGFDSGEIVYVESIQPIR